MALPKRKSKATNSLDGGVFCWYGPPKIGKTTLVHAMSPECLFLSTDRGTRWIDDIYCAPIHSWSDLKKELAALQKDHSRYDAFCVDLAQDMYLMCEHWVCKRMGIDGPDEVGHGKGWGKVRKEFMWMVQTLLSFGKSVHFICHEDTKEIESAVRKVTRLQPKLGKAAWDTIISLSDIIGYCYSTVKKVKSAKSGKIIRKEARFITLKPRESLYCGHRKQDLEFECELDGKVFLSKFTGAKSSGKEEKENKESTSKKVQRKSKKVQSKKGKKVSKRRRARN